MLAVLVFAFDKDNDPLKKFGKKSIDVTGDKVRYWKIVNYFRDDYRPQYPNINEHGLPPDYESSVPYIIGKDTSAKIYGEKHESKKMCIRFDTMAQFFDEHLVKIHIFEPGQTECTDLNPCSIARP